LVFFLGSFWRLGGGGLRDCEASRAMSPAHRMHAAPTEPFEEWTSCQSSCTAQSARAPTPMAQSAIARAGFRLHAARSGAPPIPTAQFLAGSEPPRSGAAAPAQDAKGPGAYLRPASGSSPCEWKQGGRSSFCGPDGCGRGRRMKPLERNRRGWSRPARRESPPADGFGMSPDPLGQLAQAALIEVG
jgi:hypothetical protein